MARHAGTFTSATAKAAAAKSPQHRKGWVSKKVQLRRNAELIASSKGITPLEVLCGIAGDESLSLYLRKTAADAAAPYVHRKLPSEVELNANVRIRSTFADAVKEDEPPETGG